LRVGDRQQLDEAPIAERNDAVVRSEALVAPTRDAAEPQLALDPSRRVIELVYSAAPWDVELVGRRLTVRNGPGDIFVGMTFEAPLSIVIDQGRIWRNGIKLEVSAKGLFMPNGQNVISGSLMSGGLFGMAIGNAPKVAVQIGMGANRVPFPTDAETEAVVLTIKA
jgi:hypothetical protein